jgi:c-di-GMP-related signal transduction protein
LLPETISRAVLQHEGIHGLLLRLAESAETGDVELLVDLADHLNIEFMDINRLQFEAIGWAESLSAT